MAVTFYIVTSVSMVVVNKLFLNACSTPLLYLWLQMGLAALILRATGAVLRVHFTPVFSLATIRNMAPLIVVNVGGLALNTLALHRLDAILYQLSRASVLPLTAILSFLIEGFKGVFSCLSILFACLVVCFGVVFGMVGDGIPKMKSFELIGLLFGLSSSLTTAIHSFLIKSYTKTKKDDDSNEDKIASFLELLFLNNALSAILLAPAVVILEWKPIILFGSVNCIQLAKSSVITGLMGLLINAATFLQIGLTSPLTHTVSAAARGVLQLLAAWLILGEALTRARAIGMGIALCGSALYSFAKIQESKRPILPK